MRCINCNTESEGKYCPGCGRPMRLKRITGRYLISEIGSVLMVEKGLLFTIRELFLRPGRNIRIFLFKDRQRLMKPVTFLTLSSLVYMLANNYFPFEGKYVDNTVIEQDSFTLKMLNWISHNYGYSNLLMGAFIAIWVLLFFKKYQFKYFEIVSALCFVIGNSMLLLSFFGITEYFLKIRLMPYGILIATLYISWALGSVFGKKFSNYLKVLAAYLLGSLTSIIIVLIIGLSIDLLLR